MTKYCPICGSQSYEPMKKNINGLLGPGACIRTLYYVCSGCSVMFKDPDKFLTERDAGVCFFAGGPGCNNVRLGTRLANDLK